MLDTKQLSDIITHVKEVLEKQDLYIMWANFGEVEMTELKKHFDLQVTERPLGAAGRNTFECKFTNKNA
jgi:hypothetical protein